MVPNRTKPKEIVRKLEHICSFCNKREVTCSNVLSKLTSLFVVIYKNQEKETITTTVCSKCLKTEIKESNIIQIEKLEVYQKLYGGVIEKN